VAAKTVIPGLAAARDFTGKELGPSEWVRVDQARIDAFAAVTGDRQWIHCDVERARTDSPWGSTVAHGYLSLALVPALLVSVLEIGGVTSVVNTGIDKLRLTAPVPAGSRVRLRACIQSVRPIPREGARIQFAVRLEVEGSAKPALLAAVNYAYFA
jgi:acyl dehydratase